MTIPKVEEQIPELNLRPKDYPEYLTTEAVVKLIYQRLYHKLVEKDYAKADKIRTFLSPYVDIMDDKEGSTWMWKPYIPVDS